jgi:hypothetical protein
MSSAKRISNVKERVLKPPIADKRGPDEEDKMVSL